MLILAVPWILMALGWAGTDENLKCKAYSGPPSPIVIGHRGASGYRPEHTLEAYQLAIEMGADYIEPDLVPTKDGHLIARHENEISQTTDVAIKFPDRKKTKLIDGQSTEGWFTEDFTLAEIKTLRAKERLAFRNHDYDGKFNIPTFEEIISLVRRQKRPVGIYPETKHSTYFKTIGLPIEDRLIKILKANGLDQKNSRVFIQSFEVTNLKQLSHITKVRLVQLIGAMDTQPYDIKAAGGKMTYGEMIQPQGLKNIAKYAAGVAPFKELIVVLDKEGHFVKTTDFVEDAHCAGLQVHPYTFRNDSQYLPSEYKTDPIQEYRRFFALGVDGIFSDFPDTAVSARQSSQTKR